MNTVSIRMTEVLGIRPFFTQADLLEVVEARLDPSMIERLQEFGLTRGEIAAAVIPSRTLQHRRSRREKLTLEESDRFLRILRLLAQAQEIYESPERALLWLRRPNPRLAGRSPISLLTTDTGNRMVEELLLQIDEGMYI